MKTYIVFGGPSSEYDISVRSKDLFLSMLKAYDPILVEWGKDFQFRIQGVEKVYAIDDFMAYLKENDGVFVNAMHGEFCEDGWIQEKLENAGISYTGSSSIAAKNAMDKVTAQELVKDIVEVIPTLIYFHTKGATGAGLPPVSTFPVFIKPRAKGSSIGIFKIHDEKEYRQVAVSLPSDTYLIQPAIQGMEVSVGIVKDGERYLPLPATEIVPRSAFFDYSAKYTEGGSEEITPARVDPQVMASLQNISKQIHERMGLGCYSRTDLIVKHDGVPVFLEINSLPGMTETSIVPQQLRAINALQDFGRILMENRITPA